MISESQPPCLVVEVHSARWEKCCVSIGSKPISHASESPGSYIRIPKGWYASHLIKFWTWQLVTSFRPRSATFSYFSVPPPKKFDPSCGTCRHLICLLQQCARIGCLVEGISGLYGSLCRLIASRGPSTVAGIDDLPAILQNVSTIMQSQVGNIGATKIWHGSASWVLGRLGQEVIVRSYQGYQIEYKYNLI